MGWFSATFDKNKQDGDGQPVNRLYRAHAIGLRQADELIGLVKGVLADGVIWQAEVDFLLKWMETNRHAVRSWPASVLYSRIAAALADGHMDEDEESEIMGLLLAYAGGNSAPANGYASNSTTLPLSDPQPIVEVSGHLFCFTGKFNCGTRAWCQGQIHDRGGFSAANITKKLNYLVIGEIGSRDWLHSTYGTKIQDAVEYRDAGVPIEIINEKHWFEQMSA